MTFVRWFARLTKYDETSHTITPDSLIVSLFVCHSNEASRDSRETRPNKDSRQELVCAAILCDHRGWTLRGFNMAHLKSQVITVSQLGNSTSVTQVSYFRKVGWQVQSRTRERAYEKFLDHGSQTPRETWRFFFINAKKLFAKIFITKTTREKK